MKWNTCILVLVLLFATKANSQNSTFSLIEAQQYAIEHNTSILNAELDVKSANKKVWETTAIGLPKVNATASYTNMLDIPTSLIPAEFFGGQAGEFMPVKFGTQHNMKYGVGVSQIIFSGEYIVGLMASRTFLQMSRNSKEKSETDVKELIANTYYLVLIQNQSSKIIKQSLENTQKIFEETKALYEAGFVEDTDVDQFELTVLNLKNSLENIEASVNLSKRLLKFQMGLDIDSRIELSDNLETILQQSNTDAIITQNFEAGNNIDYQMLETQEQISELSLKREYSKNLPSLSAFYNFENSAQLQKFDFADSQTDWYKSNIIGLQLDVPIFASGQRAAKISQARIELMKMQNNKQNLRQALNVEFAQAKSDFMLAYNTFQKQKKNLELSKKIYEKTHIKYKEGVSSSLELTQAQNQYLDAQSNYYSAIFNLLQAKTKINKISGKL